jgi:hypothetical protein
VVTLQQLWGMYTAEFMMGSVCSSSRDVGDGSSSSSQPAPNSSSSSSRHIIPTLRGFPARDARDSWLMCILSLPGMIGNRIMPEIAMSNRPDMEVLLATVPKLLAAPELLLGSLLHLCLATKQLHETLKGKSPVRAAQQQQQRRGRIAVKPYHELALMPAMGISLPCTVQLPEVSNSCCATHVTPVMLQCCAGNVTAAKRHVIQFGPEDISALYVVVLPLDADMLSCYSAAPSQHLHPDL